MLRAKPEALLLMSRVLGHMDPSFLVLKVPSWGFPWMFRTETGSECDSICSPEATFLSCLEGWLGIHCFPPSFPRLTRSASPDSRRSV